MSIPLEKWLVMALLTVISIFLGVIPYILVRYAKTLMPADSGRYKVTITILSCFGGGVLFATSLLHLLPEVQEGLRDNREAWEGLDSHFPLAEVIVIAGFCLIYLVEEVAHFIMVDGHHHHHHTMNTVVRNNSIAHAIPIPNVRGSRNVTMTPRSSVSAATMAGGQGQHSHNQPAITITVEDTTAVASNNTISSNNCIVSTGSIIYTDNIHEPSKLPSIMEGGTDFGNDETVMARRHSSMSEEEECPDDKTNFASSLRTFLALVALSFHAIMEGVAIGLQNSSNVWVMFGAVASHKFVISFCMGMELVASSTKALTYFSSILFFAVISPVGIIIGSVLSSQQSTQSFTVMVIEGLACGTLLYVVFFEILSRERERKSYSMSGSKAIGFIQFCALLIGVFGMGCLLTLTHEPHSQESSDENDFDGEHSHEHFTLR